MTYFSYIKTFLYSYLTATKEGDGGFLALSKDRALPPQTQSLRSY